MPCGCGGQKIVVTGVGSDLPLPDMSTLPRAAQVRTKQKTILQENATRNRRLQSSARGPCTYIGNTWTPIPGAC